MPTSIPTIPAVTWPQAALGLALIVAVLIFWGLSIGSISIHIGGKDK